MTTNSVVSLKVDVTTMLPLRRRSQDAQKAFFESRKNYDLALCTDASYKDGVASVGITDGSERWLYRLDNYMGHNVAEMVAIMQGLRIALGEFRHPKRLLIGSDSRSILDGYRSALEKGRTNQYTIAINFALSWFYEPCDVTLMWIPGHKGIKLNVMADEDAGIARQLPEESTLSFPLALWSQKCRWCRRNPSDLLFMPSNSELSKHRDADSILQNIGLQQSLLNGDRKVPGFPQFSWCELCLSEDGTVGFPQTAKHIFMECNSLASEISRLRTEFLSYGIPYELQTILDGYCIDQTAIFLGKLQSLKAAYVH